MEAIKQNQRKMSKTVAIFVLILGLGVMAFFSKGIVHYWVDESPGPTYVMYDRTLLEIVGTLIVWLIAICIVAVFVYAGLSPS